MWLNIRCLKRIFFLKTGLSGKCGTWLLESIEFVVFTVCVFLGCGRKSVLGFLCLRVLRTDTNWRFPFPRILRFCDFPNLRFCRFSVFWDLSGFWCCDFLWFSGFWDFPNLRFLRICWIARFLDFLNVCFLLILRIFKFRSFRIFCFLDWSMCGCLGFLNFWVSRFSGVRDFQELWISRFLVS